MVVWAVALTFVALRGTGTTKRHTSSSTVPGHDSPHALWLFGFDTLRLDPARPTHVERLGFAAFGDVAGAPGRVFLYDAGTGRFGVLDAVSNRIVDQTSIGSHDVDPEARPLLAPSGDAVWLVTAPGLVARHRPAGDSPDDAVPLPVPAADGAARATATRVAANATTVWAVVDVTGGTRGRDVVVYTLDARTGHVEGTRSLGALDVVTLVPLPDALAVVTRDHVAVVPRATTAALTTSPAFAVALHDGVAVGGDVWVLDDDAGLTRFTPATGLLSARSPLPAKTRPLGAGARVVSTGTSLWALLPGPAGHPFEAVLAGLDLRTDRSTFALGLPEQVAIGALAAT